MSPTLASMLEGDKRDASALLWWQRMRYAERIRQARRERKQRTRGKEAVPGLASTKQCRA